MKTKKQKVQRTRNAGTWTESEYFSRIRGALRNRFRYWKPMTEALKMASRKAVGKGRQKFEYQCNECKNWFPRKEVEIDHIIPCGQLSTYSDIVPFIQRLTPESPSAFQVLCKKDHLKKTQNERQSRRSIRNV